MSEQTIAKSAFGSKLMQIAPLAKVVALLVTVFGAIPTAITAFNAWQYNVPYSQVGHRLAQFEIWERNINCAIDYRPLATAGGLKVDVGSCPKTRDIALVLTTPDGASTNEWIAFDQLRKPGEAPPSNILDLLLGVAHAQDAVAPVQTAQAGLQVVCQSLLSRKELVRVVKDAGKCYRETISPVRGNVDKREEVPCDTKCPT